MKKIKIKQKPTMNELKQYLQDLQDEGIIHRDVKSHILYLVNIAIDELNDDAFEDDTAGGMRNCGDVD